MILRVFRWRRIAIVICVAGVIFLVWHYSTDRPLAEAAESAAEESDEWGHLTSVIHDPISDIFGAKNFTDGATSSLPNYNVHTFYYPWYGNPHFDGGKYYHWNHEYLPHWRNEETVRWPSGRHVPPEDIGSNFYPTLGCYSSRDPAVIRQHMQWIRSTGVGVVAVSYYPEGLSDSQGHSWFDAIPIIMDVANSYSLKVAFHIEPFQNRTIESIRSLLEGAITKFGSHPAFYRHTFRGKTLPLFYAYDSYLIPDRDWKSLLGRGSSASDGKRLSIRQTKIDVFMIGLLLEEKERSRMLGNGFDGYYTYFAARGFTGGSTYEKWRYLAKFASKNKMLFIPSVGPGYVDDRVRPWNKANTHSRQDGNYYIYAWSKAIESGASIISITSFNEWHEGTQIEPAVPYLSHKEGFRYLDYGRRDPGYYLSLTHDWVKRFTGRQQRTS